MTKAGLYRYNILRFYTGIRYIYHLQTHTTSLSMQRKYTLP
jgi:hypothetical protein